LLELSNVAAAGLPTNIQRRMSAMKAWVIPPIVVPIGIALCAAFRALS
jgi:hypothetical protein